MLVITISHRLSCFVLCLLRFAFSVLRVAFCAVSFVLRVLRYKIYFHIARALRSAFFFRVFWCFVFNRPRFSALRAARFTFLCVSRCAYPLFLTRFLWLLGGAGARIVTPVGFEPTRIAPPELESGTLDHSAKVS